MSKKISLKTSDGESFVIDEAVALKSQTLKRMIEDNCASKEIPLPNVTSAILAKVIEYCKKHVEVAAADDAPGTGFDGEEELKTWDADFVKVDQNTLFDIILAANYLDIPELLLLTCKTVADIMRGKTPRQMREHFNIENDYTPEEEEEVRQENMFAFE